MTTIEAVKDAFLRGKVRKAYKPGTFRKMKQRVERGEVTIGWMIDFLIKHNYTVRHEYAWMKPRVRKGGMVQYEAENIVNIVEEPRKEYPADIAECTTHSGKPNTDDPDILRCLTCLHPIQQCACGEFNTTETPVL